MKFVPDWVRPGKDHELAATRYAGRESATDLATRKAAAKKRAVRTVGIAEAARDGQAWEDRSR